MVRRTLMEQHLWWLGAAKNELVGPPSRAKLVVLAGEVGGRWSEETVTFLRLVAAAHARSESALLRRRAEQGWRMRWGGEGCWLAPPPVPLLLPCWNSPPMWVEMPIHP